MNLLQAIIFYVFIVTSLTAIIPLDTSQLDKHGKAYKEESCNANTVIDFSFSSSTSLSFASNVVSQSSLRAATPRVFAFSTSLATS